MALLSRDAATDALIRQLGQKPPPGLRVLADEDLLELSRAIEDARHRQAAALQEAGDRALSRIPRLLRGPVRRVTGA